MLAHTAVTLLLSLTVAGTAQAHSQDAHRRSHLRRQDPHAIPPLAEITQGMPTEPPVPLSAAPTAGSPPAVSGAPNLPPIPDMSSYPPGGQHLPTDSPEVKEWLAEIAASGVTIPDIPPNKVLPEDAPPGTTLCSLNQEASSAGGASGSCWWSCSSCTRDTDVVTCPDKMAWGLTFDDGPSPYTPKVLNYLADKNLKASFYVIGANVIASHTWTHPQLTTLTNEQIVAELGWTRKAIQAVLGVTPRYFRPPYGDCDDRVRAIAKGLGLTPVIWSEGFDTDDWSVNSGGVSTQLMEGYNKMLETLPTLNNGVISLQHDWYQGTVDLAVGYFLPAALSHNPAPNFQSVIECQHQPLGMSYVETSGGSGVPAAASPNNATMTPTPSAPAGSSTKASAPTSGTTKSSTTGTPSGTASASSANTSANAAVTTRETMSGLFAMAMGVAVGVLAA
ncbi:hypothetical protein OPQ81_008034 [Rhizoctonia solani]|nr:hypothetical protein OPQ81_008034 [Rhizoctonia solani]